MKRRSFLGGIGAIAGLFALTKKDEIPRQPLIPKREAPRSWSTGGTWDFGTGLCTATAIVQMGTPMYRYTFIESDTPNG